LEGGSLAKAAKKRKKAKKPARPPTVTVRFGKAELARVKEAAKKAGAKNVVAFAKNAILEKVGAVLEEKPAEA